MVTLPCRSIYLRVLSNRCVKMSAACQRDGKFNRIFSRVLDGDQGSHPGKCVSKKSCAVLLYACQHFCPGKGGSFNGYEAHRRQYPEHCPWKEVICSGHGARKDQI